MLSSLFLLAGQAGFVLELRALPLNHHLRERDHAINQNESRNQQQRPRPHGRDENAVGVEIGLAREAMPIAKQHRVEPFREVHGQEAPEEQNGLRVARLPGQEYHDDKKHVKCDQDDEPGLSPVHGVHEGQNGIQ